MVERDARVLEMKRGGRILAQPLTERDSCVLRVKCKGRILVQPLADCGSCVLGMKIDLVFWCNRGLSVILACWRRDAQCAS